MIDLGLVAARARREGLAAVRAALTRELKQAPFNTPDISTQNTYVGGLARARRLVEALYRAALTAEERAVIDGPDQEEVFTKALKAAWDALPEGSLDDMTPETLAAALRAALRIYAGDTTP